MSQSREILFAFSCAALSAIMKSRLQNGLLKNPAHELKKVDGNGRLVYISTSL
jgi:hypothetical protein